MSEGEEFLEVELGRLRLRVPVYEDKTKTLALVKKINKRFKQIEDTSGRIDTQSFALLAAYSFAVDAEELREDSSDETRDMLVGLEKICTALRQLVDEEPEREADE